MCSYVIKKAIKPLYDKFKHTGFTITGVASKFRTTKAVRHRIKINRSDWLNLAGLNDELKIWSLYGIRESAGMTVLLNEQGKIVAIDSSVEELESYLSKL